MDMKCVKCNTNSSLSQRTKHKGRCKNCYHPFVFEPTSPRDKKLLVTDQLFKSAIADISSQDKIGRASCRERVSRSV